VLPKKDQQVELALHSDAKCQKLDKIGEARRPGDPSMRSEDCRRLKKQVAFYPRMLLVSTVFIV